MPPNPARPATRGRGARKMSLDVPPAVPGIPITQVQAPPLAPANSPVAKVAESRDALFGRLTYGAGPSLTRYSTYPADGISPEMIKACLRQADLGYPRLQAEMYEQIYERDAHLNGVARARIFEVSGKPSRVKPCNESDVARFVADFVAGVIDGIDGLDSTVEDLLIANGYGYAANEIVYAFDTARVPGPDGVTYTTALVPKSIPWVHAKHFEFDAITDEPYLVMTGGRVKLPRDKFIFHTASGTGMVERRGYMRPCLTLHAAKAWSLRDWLLYEALFAVPQISATYPAEHEKYETERTLYQQILTDWGKGIPALFPDEFKPAITAAQQGGNASSPQAAILGYCNQEISKLIQGETLTTEVGNVGAYAATETHADVRHAFIRADARKLEHTLRRDLITPIVRNNLALLAKVIGAHPAEIMRSIPILFWRIDRETSPTQRAEIMMRFAEAGLAIDENQVRDEFGLMGPTEHGKALAGKPVNVTKGGAVVGSLEAAQGHENPDPAAHAKAKAVDHDINRNGIPDSREPAPVAPAPVADATKVELTPSDLATIVTVNQALASVGLPPRDDADGMLTVAEFKAKHAGPIAEAAQAEAGKDPNDPDDDPEGGGRGGGPGGSPQTFAAGWDEAKHPRKSGQFAPKGSGDGGAKSKAPSVEQAIKDAVADAMREHVAKQKGSGGPKAKPAPKSGAGDKAKAEATEAKAAEAAPAPAPDAAPASSSPATPKKPKPFKLKVQRGPREKPPADPNTPPKPPREYHRDARGRFRTKPAPGENAAQLALPTKLPTVKKAGKEKVDPSKVPGGGRGWKVRTNTNPEASYKGRSFVMNSVADGLAEFMATPCKRPDIDGFHGDQESGWTNGAVLQAVMGKGFGDSTIWKEIASATDGKVTDLQSAFKALATPRKTGRGVRDWRDFNLSAFQDAHPAFSVLARPEWLDAKQLDDDLAEHYRAEAEKYNDDPENREAAAREPGMDIDESDLPYYGGNEKYRSFTHAGDDSDVPF